MGIMEYDNIGSSLLAFTPVVSWFHLGFSYKVSHFIN